MVCRGRKRCAGSWLRQQANRCSLLCGLVGHTVRTVDEGIALDLVSVARNLGVVVHCIAGLYWWRVSFGSEASRNRELRQAAFLTAVGFFLYGAALVLQAF